MPPPELVLPPEAWPAGIISPLAILTIVAHALAKPPPKWLTLLMVLAILAVIILGVPAYIGAILRVNDDVNWFARMGTFWCLPLFGLALFNLRRHRRDIYGGLEILFAIVVTLVLVLRPSGSDAANAIGLLTAIYILVRGLDNLHQGLSPDRRARWFWAYFRDQEAAKPSPIVVPAKTASPSTDLPQAD